MLAAVNYHDTSPVVSFIGVSLITYMLAGQLPLQKGQHGKTGRNVLQPKVKFTNLKFNCMPKKNAEPRKNKPTKKKSSAQKKANPKKKAR